MPSTRSTAPSCWRRRDDGAKTRGELFRTAHPRRQCTQTRTSFQTTTRRPRALNTISRRLARSRVAAECGNSEVALVAAKGKCRLHLHAAAPPPEVPVFTAHGPGPIHRPDTRGAAQGTRRMREGLMRGRLAESGRLQQGRRRRLAAALPSPHSLTHDHAAPPQAAPSIGWLFGGRRPPKWKTSSS